MTDLEAQSHDAFLASLIERRGGPQQEAPTPKQLRFVFVARVSTEEARGLQDPRVSREWQKRNAERAIAEHGTIVEEVFDEVSRSVPWFRRPNAADLLRRIQNRELNADALVVGEAKRMFSGNQLEVVHEILNRGGIQLWLPDLGKYDDTNLSHKLLLSLEGILGKAESDTVRARITSAMNSIAESDDPRWMGGSAPYGFKLVRLDDTSVRRKSAKGFTQTLAVDEEQAVNVRFIFESFVSGKSLRQIAQALEEQGVRSPGGSESWHVSSLSTMLSNVTYSGYRQYGKQRKFQKPWDENDPRMGTYTARLPRLSSELVVSPKAVYPAIVTRDVFSRAQRLLQVKSTLRTAQPRAKVTKVVIPLQGRMFCNHRKMEADVITKSGNIRFRLRGDRSAGTPIITVSEKVLEATAHGWLSQAFSRRNMPKVLKQLEERQPNVQAEIDRLTALREQKSRQMMNLLRLLEDGADDAITNQYRLRRTEGQQLDDQISGLLTQEVDVDASRELLVALSRQMKEVLASASRERLKALYAALNLRLDYLPETKEVAISLAPNHVLTGPSNAGNRGQQVPTVTRQRVGGKDGAPGGATPLPPTLLFQAVVPLTEVF